MKIICGKLPSDGSQDPVNTKETKEAADLAREIGTHRESLCCGDNKFVSLPDRPRALCELGIYCQRTDRSNHSHPQHGV